MRPERSIITLTIPQEIIPARDPNQGIKQYSCKLGATADYTVCHISTALIQIEKPHFLENRGTNNLWGNVGNNDIPLTFRGFRRFRDLSLPFHLQQPITSLSKTLDTINERGIEKRNNLVWFTPKLTEALAYSMPQHSEEVGIILISDARGMQPTEYYEDQGDEPIGNLAFEDLHIATIIYSINFPIPEDIYEHLNLLAA